MPAKFNYSDREYDPSRRRPAQVERYTPGPGELFAYVKLAANKEKSLDILYEFESQLHQRGMGSQQHGELILTFNKGRAFAVGLILVPKTAVARLMTIPELQFMGMAAGCRHVAVASGPTVHAEPEEPEEEPDP